MTEAGDRQFLKPISYNLKEDFFNGISGKRSFAAGGANDVSGAVSRPAAFADYFGKNLFHESNWHS
jgi:hypothetical protein